MSLCLYIRIFSFFIVKKPFVCFYSFALRRAIYIVIYMKRLQYYRGEQEVVSSVFLQVKLQSSIKPFCGDSFYLLKCLYVCHCPILICTRLGGSFFHKFQKDYKKLRAKNTTLPFFNMP